MSVAASMVAIDLNHLYIVGPAATAGEWTAELPEEMVSIGTSTFIWDGYLEEGEFKFLNQLGDYNSSIVAAAENQNVESGQTYTLIDNTSGQGNEDYKFWNPQAGECRIIANIASSPMTLSFRRPVVQMEPEEIADIKLSIDVDRMVSRVWAATPDSDACVPVELPFVQQGNAVTVTIPSLHYWTMLVLE